MKKINTHHAISTPNKTALNDKEVGFSGKRIHITATIVKQIIKVKPQLFFMTYFLSFLNFNIQILFIM